MRIGKIEGADPTPLGAPRDWNPDTHGHCGALFVRREVLSGVGFMRSAWETDQTEALRQLAGGKLILSIAGSCHPVVHLEVEAPPEDAEPMYGVRRCVSLSGEPGVRVDAVYPAGGGHRCYCEAILNGEEFSAAVAGAIQRCDDTARREGWL